MPIQRLLMMRLQPRFQAWNTPIFRLPQGRGWKEPPKRLLQNQKGLFEKRRVRNPENELVPSVLKSAYHEIGHLLAGIATGLTIKSAEVRSNATGSVDFRRKLDLDGVLNSIVFYHAGKVMMEMIYGTDPLQGCTHDFDNAYFDKLYAISKWPKKQSLIHRLYDDPQPIARAHLMQYDWKTVNALANQLNRDRSWDRHQVKSLIKAFKLDQVLSAQMAKTQQGKKTSN